MDKQCFTELRHELFASGYKPFMFPDDAEIASSYPCDDCGGMNCEGAGYKMQDSYRAFSVCPDCGRVSEF